MRLREFAILVLLAAIWGSSYLFIRVAVDPLGPLVIAGGRAIVGTACLLAYALLAGNRREIGRWRRPFVVLGLLNSAVPYGLISFAELHLTASLAGILNATTPLFTAIVFALWHRQRIAPRTLAGMALGMVGVGVLVGWSPAPLDGWLAISVLAMLLASLSYGLSSVYAKQSLTGVSSLSASIGQQSTAAVMLLPFGIGTIAAGGSDTSPSLKVVLAVLALGLLSTALGYLLYFHLIAQVGAVNTSSVTFLIPIFGILWSALFLDEPIHLAMIAGLALILSSVTLVTGLKLPAFRRPLAKPVPVAGIAVDESA